MPLQDHHQIISVDDHLVEHPRVWLDRLPRGLHDVAPQIKEVNGSQLWHYNNDAYPTLGLNAVAGKPREKWGVDPVRYEDMIPGCYDPVARVKDMDVDGVQAALCFPSFPGFGGSTFFRATDRDLAVLCVQAWNDFYIEEWCTAAPDRYIPMGIVPFWDIDLAVKETERLASMGARTISFPDTPVPFGLPSFHTDRLGPVVAVVLRCRHPVVTALRVRGLCARILLFWCSVRREYAAKQCRTLCSGDRHFRDQFLVDHRRSVVLWQVAAVPEPEVLPG